MRRRTQNLNGGGAPETWYSQLNGKGEMTRDSKSCESVQKCGELSGGELQIIENRAKVSAIRSRQTGICQGVSANERADKVINGNPRTNAFYKKRIERERRQQTFPPQKAINNKERTNS